MTETIWFHNILGFLQDTQHFLDFIPDRSQSLVEQLNAIFRFSIYLTILILVIKRDLRSIYIVVFIGLITWVIYIQDVSSKQLKDKVFETLDIGTDVKNRACTKPTKDNPFMNVSYADYSEFPNRPKACDVSDTKVKSEITKIYESNGAFIRSTDDVYNRGGGDRQFYTNASTTIPNDQEAYAKWLYPLKKTLKEDGLVNYFTPIATR